MSEVLSKWNGLGIDNIVSSMADKFAPRSNHISGKKVREDGLVEMTVEEHEGFDDDIPQEHMRFSFDGTSLMVRMTVSERPFLGVIDTRGMTGETIKSGLEDLVLRS